MDEIFVEDKKYISSKRAAKITGYAKDYVGQLCREGRVPARFVGRSWYVLETAIQDHRFGNTEPEPTKATTDTSSVSVLSSWEAPRYEASSEEMLPSINRLRAESSESASGQERAEMSEGVQDSWRTWFDRFDQVTNQSESAVQTASDEEQPPEEEETDASEENIQEDTEETNDSVQVPIRAVVSQTTVPADLLPPRHSAKEQMRALREASVHKGGCAIMRTIQVTSVGLAVVAAAVAIIGTGYLDNYIISDSQVSMLAGVSVYNKLSR